MTGLKAQQPAGIDLAGLSEEGAAVYELIRDDIISGRLGPNDRLVVAELAERHQASANAVREALQQLGWAGFVLIVHNKSARVRPIDQEFVSDIFEIRALIEPSMTRWFVGMATAADIAELERVEAAIEANNFADQLLHDQLDTRFHNVMYGRHHNQLAVEFWRKHRELLRVVSRRYTYTLVRQTQVVREHRELIELIRQGDAERAATLVATHVEGAGRHFVVRMRAATAAQAS